MTIMKKLAFLVIGLVVAGLIIRGLISLIFWGGAAVLCYFIYKTLSGGKKKLQGKGKDREKL